jgi:hypothetical protein
MDGTYQPSSDLTLMAVNFLAAGVDVAWSAWGDRQGGRVSGWKKSQLHTTSSRTLARRSLSRRRRMDSLRSIRKVRSRKIRRRHDSV